MNSGQNKILLLELIQFFEFRLELWFIDYYVDLKIPYQLGKDYSIPREFASFNLNREFRLVVVYVLVVASCNIETDYSLLIQVSFFLFFSFLNGT